MAKWDWEVLFNEPSGPCRYREARTGTWRMLPTSITLRADEVIE